MTQMESSHGADLELARQCAAGDEKAWERFMLEYRPVLYRAAQALDPSGSARELADSLYADLYGLHGAEGNKRSLFRYFQGRSSLATWLRAVLTQRYVDHLRVQRRLEPLPDEEESAPRGAKAIADRVAVDRDPFDPDRSRYLQLIRAALDG